MQKIKDHIATQVKPSTFCISNNVLRVIVFDGSTHVPNRKLEASGLDYVNDKRLELLNPNILILLRPSSVQFTQLVKQWIGPHFSRHNNKVHLYNATFTGRGINKTNQRCFFHKDHFKFCLSLGATCVDDTSVHLVSTADINSSELIFIDCGCGLRTIINDEVTGFHCTILDFAC